MGDAHARFPDFHPKKRAKHLGRLHPYWGGLNSQDDHCENRENSPELVPHIEGDEKSVTISTQGRQSLRDCESCESISNSNHQKEFSDLEDSKSIEIQNLVHKFSTLLNDSIRTAETAYSVCLLETQIGALYQAQKIAKVGHF
jgi:hypothetical protein